MDAKAKQLSSTNWWLQTSHEDVKYGTETSQWYCSTYAWCQMILDKLG